MAWVFYHSGGSKKLEPKTPPYFSLEELRDIVEGDIQAVPLRDGRWLIINDSGKIKGLPANQPATEVMHAASDIAKDDIIVGNALLCLPGELD